MEGAPNCWAQSRDDFHQEAFTELTLRKHHGDEGRMHVEDLHIGRSGSTRGWIRGKLTIRNQGRGVICSWRQSARLLLRLHLLLLLLHLMAGLLERLFQLLSHVLSDPLCQP